jgi:hypothetical protein
LNLELYEAKIIGALFTLAFSLVGFVVFQIKRRKAKQLARQRNTASVEDRFRFKDMVETRARAAEYLIRAGRSFEPNSDLDQLLGFFNHLGLHESRKMVSLHRIWELFAAEIFYYLAAAGGYIQARREKYPKEFAELKGLEKRLRKLEKRHHGVDSELLNISGGDVLAFLKREAELDQVN